MTCTESPKCRTRRVMRTVALALVLLAFPATWIVAEIVNRDRIEPGPGVIDLPSFAQNMGAPTAAYVLTINGRTYTELIGHRASFPSVPSGPPAYVFDDRGKLLAFTFDDGDDPGYLERWRSGQRHKMTPANVTQLLGVPLTGPGVASGP